MAAAVGAAGAGLSAPDQPVLAARLRYFGVMSTRLMLTAIFEPVEQGWVQARIVELPAVITAAPSRQEAEELLGDALVEYLLSLGAGEDIIVSSTAQKLPVEVVIGAA